MAEVPKDLGVLAKKIMNYEITNSSGVRELTELLRVLNMDVSAINALAAREVFDALKHLDGGSRGRAFQVARPLRHASSLAAMAARRAHTTYRLYLRHFDDLIHPQRQRAQRRFDPTK